MSQLMNTTEIPTAPLPTQFLSRREVARMFGVSTSTVTRWARAGLLATLRTPGGHYRFRADQTLRTARAGSTEPRKPD